MARHLRIRSIVKTDRTSAHERIGAICGVKRDGSHWTLTQHQAISEIEDGISMFYTERAGKRFDVVLAMDVHTHKYLKTVADRDQPDELLYLPACLHIVHTSHVLAAGA